MYSMRRSSVSLLLVMILLFLSCTSMLGYPINNQIQSMKVTNTKSGNIVHGTISIDGDAAFHSLAASESWPGTGILGNPYLIQHYYIDASTGPGISIMNTQVYFTIYNCTIFGGASTYNGISFDKVSNATIVDNEIMTDETGIYLHSSYSNTIENNNVSGCKTGIGLESSSYVTIHNNTCYDNSEYDISVIWYNNWNVITNNTCKSTGEPNIFLREVANTTFSHNSMNGRGLNIISSSSVWLNFVEFDDNTVNGSQILLVQDQVGGDYSGDYAQVVLIRCKDVIVRDMILTGIYRGMSILFCDDTIVKNITCVGCVYGLDITSGHRVTVSDCNASYCTYVGLMINWGEQEDNNDHLITNSTFHDNVYSGVMIGGEGGTTIFNNTFYHNADNKNTAYQLYVISTKDITITNNTCWNGYAGNIQCKASNSLIANNTCFASLGFGIGLDNADGTVVTDNLCWGLSSGVYISGTDSTYVANNKLNENEQGIICAGDSSYNTIAYNNCSEGGWNGIYLGGNSNNLLWKNICKNNTGSGIYLYNLNQINTVANNTCSNNTDQGIYSYRSEWTIIANNTCEDNSIGLLLDDQTYNTSVYWNLLIDNTANGMDNGDDNYITNNYWSDYVGVDTTPADGIGDTPYPIAGGASNEDPYPWMSPNFVPILTSWVTAPTDQYVEYHNGFSLDLDTTGPVPLVMWINDTTHFSIDSNWVITNITPIDIGVYGLRVTGRNMYGHHLVAEFNIIVQDTTAPVWVSVPADIEKADMKELWTFDLAATDISGISHFWISDWENFTIDEGYIINQWELLSRGNYSLEVRAYDPYDNYVSKEFILSLVDMDPPIINYPDDITTTTAEGFIISWYPTDDTPWKYEIFRDGALYETDTWVQYDEITVNTLEDTVGEYNYTVIVYDLDGNTVTDTVIVTVTPGPPTSTTEPTDTEPTLPPPIDMTLILIYGTVGVVVIVIVIIALKKRR